MKISPQLETTPVKELVAAGHALAKELHCAESAALVSRLATALDVQVARANALASLLSVPKDIPDSVYEVLCQACGGGEKACDFADELWNACRAAMLLSISQKENGK